MGLPSGTLWLDRLVGAQSPTEPGLYYQWGAVNGHTGSDGFSFDEEAYSAQGLDAISSNLTESQDAARAFYGPDAKMPSQEQVQELLQYTTSQSTSRLLKLTSVINGNSIVLYRGGIIQGTQFVTRSVLRAWLTDYYSSVEATALHDTTVSHSTRPRGLNIMAVHS